MFALESSARLTLPKYVTYLLYINLMIIKKVKILFQSDLVQVNSSPNQIAKETDKLGRKKK